MHCDGSDGPPGKILSWGNQYLLVALDYATSYPKVIPLRKKLHPSDARERLNMFSRTGFPKESLMDQGTLFMLKVIADLTKLFQIKQ